MPTDGTNNSLLESQQSVSLVVKVAKNSTTVKQPDRPKHHSLLLPLGITLAAPNLDSKL
jgi:hypothetical protein